MIHSSEVPQVLNLTTGSITTQFHVVFDDLFSTVSSIEREEQPPSHWNDLCLDNTELIPMDNPPPLSPEWLNEMDGNLNTQSTVRTNQVRQDLLTSNTPSQQEPLFLPNTRTSTEGSGSVVAPVEQEITTSSEGVPTEESTASEGAPQNPSLEQPHSEPTGVRRSKCSNKGQYSSTRYINEVFLSAVTTLNDDLDEYNTALAYKAELQTDMNTYEIDITDPRVYNAKFSKRGTDPDAPTFHRALSGPDANKYIEAMKEEITNLKRMNT